MDAATWTCRQTGVAVAVAIALGSAACPATDAGDRGSTSGETAGTTVATTTGASSTGAATSTDTTIDPGTSTSPSDTTGDASDSSGGSSTGAPGEDCPPTHVCFLLPGEFHVADELVPTAIYDFDLPEGSEFSVVEVELFVTHGGWYGPDPAGLHNIFWLHRGTFANFTWLGGVVGYVNVRGPGTNVVRTRHDLDVLDLADSQTFNINGVVLSEGTTYRVFYRYDTTAAEVLVEIYEGDTLVAQGTDVPTTDKVRNTDGDMFIYFGNGTDVAAPGPEVPSLGWAFADLRVELIP